MGVSVPVERTASATAVEAVVFRVLAEAGSPAWSPLKAPRRLVAYAEGDLAVLQAARAMLLADHMRSGRVLTRALATLAVAVAVAQDPGG